MAVIADSNLPVDGRRLWADLMGLAELTDPGLPYTRRSFSPLFMEGRAWLARRFEDAGLGVRIDAGGNLLGRLEGRDPAAPTILIGSHSDTVPAGGRFDGIAGVLAGLEIVRSLRERGVVLDHAIEVADFLAEEPSEYGLSCIGSRAMAGMLPDELDTFRDAEGDHLPAAIDRVGGDSRRLSAAMRRDIGAYFELHIEQGPVLETGGLDLGIVTSISGVVRQEIVFEGRADHAGTTPMDLRRDAGLAAADFVHKVAELGARHAGAGRGHFVATVGIIEIAPNAANVVPGRARMLIDARAEDWDNMLAFLAALDAAGSGIAAGRGTPRTGWRRLTETLPAACDRHLMSLLESGAAALNLSTLRMASGAGHDANFMTHIAPAAMVFVPCRKGRSHAPEEWAEPVAIAAGAAAILEAVVRFDRERGAR